MERCKVEGKRRARESERGMDASEGEDSRASQEFYGASPRLPRRARFQVSDGYRVGEARQNASFERSGGGTGTRLHPGSVAVGMGNARRGRVRDWLRRSDNKVLVKNHTR
jgi:hypothetical protein